jgi:hypothetical protein
MSGYFMVKLNIKSYLVIDVLISSVTNGAISLMTGLITLTTAAPMMIVREKRVLSLERLLISLLNLSFDAAILSLSLASVSAVRSLATFHQIPVAFLAVLAERL